MYTTIGRRDVKHGDVSGVRDATMTVRAAYVENETVNVDDALSSQSY